MAMHDWNHDGKKDGMDNFIEYQIFKDTTNSNSISNGISNSNNSTSKNCINRDSSSQRKMSKLGVFLCIFSGLFWQALLFALLDVDIGDIPSLLIIVLWIIFSAITIGVVKAI